MLTTPEMIREAAQWSRVAAVVPGWLRRVPLYQRAAYLRAADGLEPIPVGMGSPSPQPNGFPSPPRVSFPTGDERFAFCGPPMGAREKKQRGAYRDRLLEASGENWLRSLPFITKDDLRREFPRNFLSAGTELATLVEENLVEVEHTSGTAEERTALLLGTGWWAAQETAALRQNGLVAKALDECPAARRVTINSPVCNSEICYTSVPTQAERIVGNALFTSLSRYPFLWSEVELARMAAEAVAWEPVFLEMDPIYGVIFAQYCERQGIRLPSLRFIICSYEFVSVVHRRILQRVFGVPVFNLYGATETGHLLMETERGEMVASLETAFLEVVEPDARGIGELVVTTLTNDYMPLIRYRIGDLVERHEQPYRTVYILHGREKDAFISADGERVTTWQIDECFADVKGITHYQLLHQPAGKWRLRLVVEGAGPEAAELAELRRRLMARLGIKQGLEFQPTDLLMAEGSGKFRLGYPQK